MSYSVVKTAVQPGRLDCYLMNLRPGNLFSFLGHDPRSRNWKLLDPYLQEIYKSKQRTTDKGRIDALEQYISTRVMDNDKHGALPPISVIQFEPFKPGQLTEIGPDAYSLDLDRAEAHRVLIDGLARVTALLDLRKRFEVENPVAAQRLSEFQFSVALYVPSFNVIGADIAGALFTDFNLYAWPVSAAKAVSDDIYNPYKNIADRVGNSAVISRYHGLKIGTPNLGSKDTNWTTELTMAQFCKIVVEGARGMGKLTKPVSSPKVRGLDLEKVGDDIAAFFEQVERAMTSARFGDRGQIFRTAHGLYAIAIVLNDALFGRKTSVQAVVNAIASTDWTWGNEEFRDNIGRTKPNKKMGGLDEWHLNTGQASIIWMAGYLRKRAGIMPVTAAAA